MESGSSISLASTTPELRLIKTLWGIDEPISPELFSSIQSEGYYGVEVIRLTWMKENRDVLVDALNQSGLACVCQIHTSGGYIDESTGQYVYCGSYDVQTHKEDFRNQLRECTELFDLVSTKGCFVNVHAGVDAWSKDEAIDFLTFCLNEIQASKTGGSSSTIPVVTFETHRQRLFGSPFQTRDLLEAMEVNTNTNRFLKLNADLSHWYCACERVFDPSNEDRDRKWWPDLLQRLAGRCHYIHARFGWAQGPQIPDPSASECTTDRNLQIEIWKELVRHQLGRRQPEQNDDNNNCNIVYMSPEYGPAPYMVLKPGSQEPLASLPSAVSYTKTVIEELFASVVSSS